RPPGREGAAPPDSGRGPYEQLMAIQSRVTRKDYRGRAWGENQKVKVEEALRVCTLHGAHASFEEKVKGSITQGKLADFVLLAEDPHRVAPERIKDIRVERTVVGRRPNGPRAEGVTRHFARLIGGGLAPPQRALHAGQPRPLKRIAAQGCVKGRQPFRS